MLNCLFSINELSFLHDSKSKILPSRFETFTTENSIQRLNFWMDKWSLYHDTVYHYTTQWLEFCPVQFNSMTITDQNTNIGVQIFCVLVISCPLRYHSLKTENSTGSVFISTEDIQNKVTAVLETIIPLSAYTTEMLEYLIRHQCSQNRSQLFFWQTL